MNQNFYNSNSFGFDQFQPPQYPVIHHPPQETSEEMLQARENLMQFIQTFLKKFNRISFRETPKVLTQSWDKFFKIQHAQPEDTHELLRKLLEDLQIINEELAEFINSPSWNRPAFFDDDDDEYSIQVSDKSPIAIAPILPSEEPENSLSMGDEHLDTILETKSYEVIKSSVEDLVPILSEFEGILDNMCDVPFCDNSPPLDVLTDHFELLFNFNDDCTSSEDDSFEDIDYVEASPPDSELVSLEKVKDEILREKLLNIHLLIDKIKSLNNNPTPNCVLKSHSSFFLSYSDNSLPEFETFSDHTKETSSGSTTTPADNSPPEYDSFLFEIEPDQGELSSDLDFSSSDDSLGFGLEISFPFGTRNKIFDPGIFIEVQSERLLSREEFSISFIRDPLFPVFDTLLPFLSKKEDKVFKRGILSYLFVSHRDKTTFDFSENPMMMYGGDIPLWDVPYLHFYPLRPSSSMGDRVKWIENGAKAVIYGFVAIKSAFYTKSRQSREKSPSMPWERARDYESNGGSHETFQCQPMDQNINSFGFDQIQFPQYHVIHHPSQEMSEEILQAKENLMKSIQTFLNKFNCISFGEMPKVLSRAWENVFEIQHAQPEDTNELLQKLLEDLQIISGELAEYINSPSWNHPTLYNIDEEHSIQYKEYLDNSSNAITTVIPTKEPDDDELLSNEDVPMEKFEIYSNPLFDDEEINSNKIDPHYFNAEFNLIESLPNRDTLFDSSPKREHEEYISLMEKLLTINSFSRLLENFHANMIVESLSPSPIPVEDSDSQREEIDLFLDTDDLMPPGSENDDYDSEGDIHIFKELLSNDTPPILENESSNFDHHNDPSFPRPPSEPPDVEIFFEPDSGVLTTNMVKENEDKVFKPGILSYLLVSHQDKTTSDFSENPMMMYGGDIPLWMSLLLFNSKLKIFSGKLKSRWSGPFTISEIYPYGTTKLIHPDGCNFKVNCHRLKHYHGGDPLPLEILDVTTFPKDN
nr:reverse transcriptase domain-containing protein [Tanacetum cinerariifolium]